MLTPPRVPFPRLLLLLRNKTRRGLLCPLLLLDSYVIVYFSLGFCLGLGAAGVVVAANGLVHSARVLIKCGIVVQCEHLSLLVVYYL